MPNMKICESNPNHKYDADVVTFCPECSKMDKNIDQNLLRPRARQFPDAQASRPQADAESAVPPKSVPPPKARGGRKTVVVWPGLGTSLGQGSGPGVETRPQDRPDPVVGWLVAHSGPALGRDFRIRWGNNSIGAEFDQHICISDDPQISGRGHAFVVYDPKSNKFYLRPGDESKGLVRLDDDLVMNAVELHSYSVIEIGGSRLVFVPLCYDDGQGAGFRWSFGDKSQESQ